MALLHSHSCEAIKSEIDLFSLPPTQTAIERSHWMQYKPISSLSDDSPIEFVIPGTGEEYLDLSHSMLKISLKLVRRDAAVATDYVGGVNNLLQSLFSQVDVYLNQKSVTSQNNTYAYRAYIETLLNYGTSAKNSHLTSGLWYSDTAGEMDTIGDGNKGLKTRKQFTNTGKVVDLLGPIHCDIMNQGKLILNGVEVRLRLVRSRNEFCLMDSTTNYSIHIVDASLMMRRVKLSPEISLAHASILSKNTAKYPLTRVEVKSFVLHSGILSESLDNIILGQLPKRIIIGFVNNKAFSGDRKYNPFNFDNYKINFLSLYVDGVQYPVKPLQPDFVTNDTYVDSFHTLFSGTGIHFLNEGNCIDRIEYKKGYTLFAFDLTPDLSAHCPSHWNLIRNGSVRIEVGFHEALAHTVNCIVYAEYDNVLEIDASRQVIVDFGN